MKVTDCPGALGLSEETNVLLVSANTIDACAVPVRPKTAASNDTTAMTLVRQRHQQLLASMIPRSPDKVLLLTSHHEGSACGKQPEAPIPFS